MIWDFLNFLVLLVHAVLDGLFALLPQSPLYVSSATLSSLAGVTGYASYFVPIDAMAAVLVLYVSGLILWLAILLTKQFVEAIIP